MRISFEDIEFLPETEALFCDMVEATMEAVKSSGRLFLLSKHSGGNSLILVGPPRRDWHDIDEAALNDFAVYGLLQIDYGSRGNPIYRVSNDGHRYYRYLQERRGTPIDQVETTIRTFFEGERFALRYPRAVSALGKATEILWKGKNDDQTASELGAALRAALQDFTDEFLQRLGIQSQESQERPIHRLRGIVDAIAGRTGGREPPVLRALVGLAHVELREIQRIHHVRDVGEVESWDELRRATFVLTFLMYELDRAAGSP
jgi:hypothetical protein